VPARLAAPRVAPPAHALPMGRPRVLPPRPQVHPLLSLRKLAGPLAAADGGRAGGQHQGVVGEPVLLAFVGVPVQEQVQVLAEERRQVVLVPQVLVVGLRLAARVVVHHADPQHVPRAAELLSEPQQLLTAAVSVMAALAVTLLDRAVLRWWSSAPPPPPGARRPGAAGTAAPR